MIITKKLKTLFLKKSKKKTSINNPSKRLLTYEDIEEDYSNQINSLIDNEECNLNVVNINSLRTNRINVCCHCGQRLDMPNCEVSSRDEFNIYYIRCTCHFVNKIKHSEVLVAPISELELVRALFEANGCRFNSYSSAEDNIIKPFD